MPSRREISLQFVAHAHVELGPILDLGAVLVGRKRVIPITGGFFEGPMLNATILDGGADWQTVAEDGTGVIDTRYNALGADGEVFSIATQGFRHGSPEVLARLAAGEMVDPDSYSFRVTARIECGAPSYAWVNRTIFVATAARFASAVTYDLYAVL
jgi:hypothetical protein